jgi:hypothetical protein
MSRPGWANTFAEIGTVITDIWVLGYCPKPLAKFRRPFTRCFRQRFGDVESGSDRLRRWIQLNWSNCWKRGLSVRYRVNNWHPRQMLYPLTPMHRSTRRGRRNLSATVGIGFQILTTIRDFSL